ncbi:MAG: inositol monophosphatase family protein [Acidimicrobiales bacterium]
MSDDELLALLLAAADAVAAALADTADRGLVAGSASQHRSDLATDAAALAVLRRGGVSVLSEESGLTRGRLPLTVVLDPLDGSTNAAQGIPWYATSLCAVDSLGLRAAVVRNLAGGECYTAVRGGGAACDGVPLAPSQCTEVGEAVIGISGMPPASLGWRQFRAFGAAALDLCAVAAGRLDAYVDCSVDAHGPWDYLGGVLVCLEAGAVVADASARPLAALDHGARRTPVAAATEPLLAELLERRAAAFLTAGAPR